MNEGFPIIQSYINSLHCKESWSQELCHIGYQKFKERISYFQLRSSHDYELLHAHLTDPRESLRIFYLSVSPSLYEDIASNINHYARPKSELRVVFEKPFGMVSSLFLLNRFISHWG
jgi:glucose-6-phosphate 1-dehydrogenase